MVVTLRICSRQGKDSAIALAMPQTASWYGMRTIAFALGLFLISVCELLWIVAFSNRSHDSERMPHLLLFGAQVRPRIRAWRCFAGKQFGDFDSTLCQCFDFLRVV